MLDVLAHRVYRHLFFAQVMAMIGTGLTTVSLADRPRDWWRGCALYGVQQNQSLPA